MTSEKRAFFDAYHAFYGDPKAFCVALRARMKEHDVSSFALARKSGVHRSQIARYVRGKTKPRMEAMLILDEALELLIEQKRQP